MVCEISDVRKIEKIKIELIVCLGPGPSSFCLEHQNFGIVCKIRIARFLKVFHIPIDVEHLYKHKITVPLTDFVVQKTIKFQDVFSVQLQVILKSKKSTVIFFFKITIFIVISKMWPN